MRLETGPELLDEDTGTPDAIRASLADLWWINRRLGGLRSWPRLLDRALAGPASAPRTPAAARPAEPLVLLDVGAGTGELTEAMAAHLRGCGQAVHAIRLDRRLSHFGAAKADAVVADALALPFAARSVDIVTANLFLHHFHDVAGQETASRLMRSLFRVARRAVVINDLERGWIPWLFARTLFPRLRVNGRRFSPLTLHDGPRSVRQAYTRPELRNLAARAGLHRWEVRRLWPYRLCLIAWRSDEPYESV